MDSYDEDLNENPFFQSLVASCPDLFSQCVLEQWLICVPRRDSLPKYAFTLEDYTHHILRPLSSEVPRRHWSGGSAASTDSLSSLSFTQQPSALDSNSEADSSFLSGKICLELEVDVENKCKTQTRTLKGNWNYQTLTHINVELNRQSIVLDVEVPVRDAENNNYESPSNGFVQLRKEVLFDETFYTNDRRKYKVLCVASPLNSKVDIEDEGFGNAGLGIWNLTSLRDCIDFIWVKGSLKILENYDAYIKLFLHNHPALESLPLAIQRNLVNTLYLKCLEYAETTGITTTIKENPSLSNFILKRLKLATETYVLNGVYRSLISAITSVTAVEDAFINKITRNLAEMHPQDLDINPGYWNVLGKARYEMGRISSYSSPLGKYTCMKRTIRHIRTNAISEVGDAVLSTDELIPIWVYLIVKNPIGNWTAQLEFLRNFQFSSVDEPDNENSFYVVTLEASLEHLKSGKILGIPENEKDVGSPCDLGEAWLYTLHQNAYDSSNPKLAQMFDLIRLGDCVKLEEVIEDYEVERYEFNKKQKEPKVVDAGLLCHPLCLCKKCQSLYNNLNQVQPMPAAVDLTTDDGLTLLHVACIYGRPKVVDSLIGAGSAIEAQDSQGNRPLHYAASRGHQNALLLLLHAGCSLGPLNNSMNCPLALAAENGHEGCVKALIYYAEHVGKSINLSESNAKGDTPLHFASRWGFIGIVSILTEHGAAITVPNLRHATPIDCAHDIHVLKILQRSLRRRSLVQTNHGDFVNIEMMQKEDSGGIVMLISEPKETNSSSPIRNQNIGLLKQQSRSASRVSSRRSSTVSIPNLSLSNNLAVPRSRRISAFQPPNTDAFNTTEDATEKCLMTVARHLSLDPVSPDFVLNVEPYGFSEQEHLKKVSVERLDDAKKKQEEQEKRDRDVIKLFTAISIGDVPLSLFYLGIPADEIDNPENQSDLIIVIPPCHPLCPCNRCAAKNSGLGLDLNIQDSEGLSPLHTAVQLHILILVKILIRYGANVNLQSAIERKTALDFALERGYQDIEIVLINSGALSSTSFCPESVDECEK